MISKLTYNIKKKKRKTVGIMNKINNFPHTSKSMGLRIWCGANNARQDLKIFWDFPHAVVNSYFDVRSLAKIVPLSLFKYRVHLLYVRVLYSVWVVTVCSIALYELNRN